jgi:zinc transport system substrate-binding protein
MASRVTLILLAATVVAGGCAGGPSDSAEPPARIAVATSYLGAAARDLLDEDVPLVNLCGPGTCPGHFDITPGHLARLRRCRVLLRFDFQKHFDAKLQAAVDDGLAVVEVPESGGLCEPETYRAACRAVADALVAEDLLSLSAADARLAAIEARAADLAETARADVRKAGLTGAPVVAAHHQARFCRWLGLEVAGEFTASDDPAALNRAVADARRAGARLVIGNVPAGRVVADRFAEALKAPVVMFENFPLADDGRRGYDALVRRNVERLCAAGTGAGHAP